MFSIIFSWIVLIFLLLLNLFLLWGLFGFFRGALSGAPFIPTGNDVVQKMIAFAGEVKGKKIYDLGCGDGRIVFAAEKMGAIAVGVEISFPIYCLAVFRRFLAKSHATFFRASLWNVDISDADVVFLYLLPEMMKKFEKEKYPTLKKGCIIISHGFSLGDIPAEKIEVLGLGKRVLKIVKE